MTVVRMLRQGETYAPRGRARRIVRARARGRAPVDDFERSLQAMERYLERGGYVPPPVGPIPSLPPVAGSSGPVGNAGTAQLDAGGASGASRTPRTRRNYW